MNASTSRTDLLPELLTAPEMTRDVALASTLFFVLLPVAENLAILGLWRGSPSAGAANQVTTFTGHHRHGPRRQERILQDR